ncbi:MAG: hypothetical protein ALECFALPRED_010654 [Alectoria fallacina]|uniref:Uncharacterized protein n=1 Tax=Alectoria fallacina TaxID=1903189 RepID=A0A8H3EI50_9LECA|nr:MAG: hypothetical protein ALECFALPRED_010654 [Alectoria fallacina]
MPPCSRVSLRGKVGFGSQNVPVLPSLLLPAILGESLMASQIEPQPTNPPAWSPPFEPTDDVFPGIMGEPQIAGQIEPQSMDPAADGPRFQVWSSPIEPLGEWAQVMDGSDPFAFRPPGAWAQAGQPTHPNEATYGHSFQSTDLMYQPSYRPVYQAYLSCYQFEDHGDDSITAGGARICKGKIVPAWTLGIGEC